MSLFSADLLRSGFFYHLRHCIWLSIKERFAQNTGVGLLMVSDLFFVDSMFRKVLSRSQVEVPFQESPADAEILKDTSNYRVF
jgi:hypothetical protein